MASACVFCGSDAPLTLEHVFGQWLSRIGLPMEKALHTAGHLNHLGRSMGVRVPFTQTVKSFCASCNNGWMSKLEADAQRILTPFILDKPGRIEAGDLEAVATWAHKTALVSMLLSSQDERDQGHGVPEAEYHALFETQGPLPDTNFWIGRTDMPGWGARVTPLVVYIGGNPITDVPQGYAMTVTVGALVLFGIRFTSPALSVDVETSFDLARVWPAEEAVEWPAGRTVTPENYMELANARSLRSQHPLVSVRPLTSAVDLPESELRAGQVQLPLMCGRHHALYPAEIVREAQRGRFYRFTVACACPMSYIVETHETGVRCIAAADAGDIEEEFAALPGAERTIASSLRVKTRTL